MKHLYTATLASLEHDGSQIEFSLAALRDMIDQANADPIAVYPNADTRQPPVGRLISAGLKGTDTGAVVSVTVELFSPLPEEGGGKLYVVPACILREAVHARGDDGSLLLKIVTHLKLLHGILTTMPQDKTLEPLRPADDETLVSKIAAPAPDGG